MTDKDSLIDAAPSKKGTLLGEFAVTLVQHTDEKGVVFWKQDGSNPITKAKILENWNKHFQELDIYQLFFPDIAAAISVSRWTPAAGKIPETTDIQFAFADGTFLPDYKNVFGLNWLGLSTTESIIKFK